MDSSSHQVAIGQLADFPEAVFEVTVVSPDNSKSQHSVTLSRHYHEEISNGACTPETLLTQSFYFLLEREPKESILAEFDLPLIGTYFPEYEAVIKKNIGHV